MNWKTKNRYEFYHRSAHLDERISKHFLRGNEAILPCRITGYYDVIHKYSVDGFEALNPDFTAYLSDMIRFIPPEYNLILRLSGAELSDYQKQRITEAIQEDTMYELGAVEEERDALKQNLIWNIAGLLMMGAFLTIMDHIIGGMPREFLYIAFWFFADVVISYVLTNRRMMRNKYILAGRLASMKVEFDNPQIELYRTD